MFCIALLILWCNQALVIINMIIFWIGAGEAKNNRVVIVALYPIVKESFQIYYDITEIMGILVDRFMEQEVQDCVKIHEMFCRVGKQFDELDIFYAWSKSIGIARSSEYPELEKITRKKLEIMDEFIRDKSALAQCKKSKPQQEEQKEVPEEENVEDMNAIKALPPPEGFVETPVVEEKKEVEPIKKEEKETKITQQEGDLLNLGEGTITSEEHADKLALALFDGGAQPTNQAPALAWEAFNDENADWESTLVQSASNLSGQKPSLPGGFDMLLLDGMYKQAETNAAIQVPGSGVSGSASSVALGSAGRPAMLALPAPPTPEGSSVMTSSADPFAASLAVAPPPYVQMSDMEKKQKLLVDEQLMWQQYAKDGMQGQLGIAKMQQHNPYNMGGYTHSY